tara:strand:+ start:213 stop:992 length:780 start_codon:yes stop_codon:yes gene_type:complete
MPTKKSVQDIKTNLLRPALTSHFEVEIGVPNALLGFLGNSQGKLNLLCSEAVLPGSALATIDITNDYQGVTERHAYRRQFDQSIDLTFYVDAGNYIPIKFFEKWISYIMNEPLGGDDNNLANPYYSYRTRYPDEYTSGEGLTVTKFEKDYQSQIKYQFIRSFPLAITSMPVSYEASSLLKVSVQMTYIRYILLNNTTSLFGAPGGGGWDPFGMAQFNIGGFLSNTAANLVGSAVNQATGSAALGNFSGALAGNAVQNAF